MKTTRLILGAILQATFYAWAGVHFTNDLLKILQFIFK